MSSSIILLFFSPCPISRNILGLSFQAVLSSPHSFLQFRSSSFVVNFNVNTFGCIFYTISVFLFSLSIFLSSYALSCTVYCYSLSHVFLTNPVFSYPVISILPQPSTLRHRTPLFFILSFLFSFSVYHSVPLFTSSFFSSFHTKTK